MGSMNNWLAFSLSPQELPTPQPHQTHPSPAAVSRFFSGDNVSTDCYGISADSSSDPPLGIPIIRPDGSFGILEALNRTHHQPQEWGIQDLEFKGNTSDLSMVVGSSSNQTDMDEDEPKLEDFLGGHTLSDHHQKLAPGCSSIPGDYIYSNCTLQLPATTSVASNSGSGVLMNSGGSNGIGLSTIKTWLRNQPAPSQQLEINSNDVAGTSSGGDCGSASVVGKLVSLANSQALSLSMSTGSQSSSPLPPVAAEGGGRGESSSMDNKQDDTGSALDAQSGAIEAVPRKSIDTFGQRTSIYRGVTRHRWTGRYEAHLWDNSCRREGQTRKGRQVYLGGYDKEEKAARAYDLAALKYWGTTTTTNFPIGNYEKELEEMKHMTRQEYVASLRRKSSGFSRGASIYRGVTRHHQHGRWQARIGRVAGNKDLYLGTFSTQEEAAEAYDIAAIKFRGLNAVTNFDMSRYDVKSILESSTLPIGGAAKRLKEVSEHPEHSIDGRRTDDAMASQLTDGLSSYAHHHNGWPTIAFQQPQSLGFHHPYGQQRGWCKPEDGAIPVAQSLQEIQQVHVGSGTHNFFLPSLSNNLMSLDSSSMEHSTGSNSVVYTGSMGSSSGGYQGYMSGNSTGYVMPLSTVVVDQSHNNQGSSSYGESEMKQLMYENMLANTDPYTARNLYYLSQQSSGSVVKENGHEQISPWVPSSTQAIASRPGNVGGSHGAPTFSVWNDA